ncbi:MAG TPA: hypothetical protein VFT12_08370 [Thermoanaerobaculia bacterium]|nr:hypothetical protein [Thermoanaerobaculia bacterium]
MPRTDITQLPDTSRSWIFGISPALDELKQQRLLAAVDAFLAGWEAHGHPIRSAREIIEGMFLVIAVDKEAETSGCSIDRLFSTLAASERELGVSILDSGRIFFRHGDGRPDAISRAAFRENADGHTIVFDTNVEQLGVIRSGAWQKPAAQSWHRDLLRRAG